MNIVDKSLRGSWKKRDSEKESGTTRDRKRERERERLRRCECEGERPGAAARRDAQSTGVVRATWTLRAVTLPIKIAWNLDLSRSRCRRASLRNTAEYFVRYFVNILWNAVVKRAENTSWFVPIRRRIVYFQFAVRCGVLTHSQNDLPLHW